MELDVVAYGADFGLVMLPTPIVASWPSSFHPRGVNGTLRVAAGRLLTTTGWALAHPWIGDVDEVLALHGVMPAVNGAAAADLVRWAVRTPSWLVDGLCSGS